MCAASLRAAIRRSGKPGSPSIKHIYYFSIPFLSTALSCARPSLAASKESHIWLVRAHCFDSAALFYLQLEICGLDRRAHFHVSLSLTFTHCMAAMLFNETFQRAIQLWFLCRGSVRRFSKAVWVDGGFLLGSALLFFGSCVSLLTHAALHCLDDATCGMVY